SKLTFNLAAMRKVNTNNMEELVWASPKRKFAGAGKQVSEALGRKPFSSDLMERHPFDVEICRIPPGKAAYPYHTHSAQWEFYHIISGHGVARHKDSKTTSFIPSSIRRSRSKCDP